MWLHEKVRIEDNEEFQKSNHQDLLEKRYCLVRTPSYEIQRTTKELKLKIKKSQQHQEFPSGLPSKYYPGPMLLNFSDRTRTGVFNMVWPLTERRANICPHDKLLSTTCICILHMSCAQHYLHLLNANTFADFGNQ